MKTEKFSEAMSELDDKYVEKAINYQARKRKPMWIKWASMAACFCLMIVITVVAVYQIQNRVDPNGPDVPPVIPIVNLQSPTNAPQFYGDENSEGMSSDGQMDVSPLGISVTAELVEILPDTYTFFDDWKQYEFRLLRMKTVKLLKGMEMTEEFYYMIPADFMTDYSVYDKFVIIDMAQFGYEHHVMYNKTQEQAECLELVLFGYRIYGYVVLGQNFIAYDNDGNRDERLWQSCDAWIEVSSKDEFSQYVPMTLQEAEEKEYKYSEDNPDYFKNNYYYVHLLKDIHGEAKTVLDKVTSLENGIYVPHFGSNVLWLMPEVQFHATRNINGFATNEMVSIWDKDWTNGNEDTYQFTKARLDENDLNALPDLTSGVATIVAAYNEGNITPPHIEGYSDMSLRSYGIFGWYAKTESGVLGIVRITWSYKSASQGTLYDDAYFIIEYGENECKPITRDDLLERLGEYETTYIYDGDYSEYGKEIVLPMY